MTIKRRKFAKGIRIKQENIEGGTGAEDLTLDGEIAVDANDDKVKVRLNGSTESVVTEAQTQTVTNKTINADNNTISNIETDNLKAGVLVTDISAASADTEIPSALAVKTALAGQNEASEITYDNSTSGLTATNVKAAIDEVEGRLDTTEGVATGAASDLSDHIADSADAHDASAISSVASGNLAATDVQAALDELQADIDTRALASGLSDHLADTADAHDASAISFDNAASGLTATEVQAAIDEVEGRLDTTEGVASTAASDLTTHYSDTTTHGTTGDIVGTSDTQDLSNKTFTDAITVQELVSTPSTPASGDAKLYVKDDRVYKLNDSGSEEEIGSGGQGGINHISNYDFELNIDGYVKYLDAAGENAVDGTGGSSGIAFVRNTTTPIRGTADGKIAKDAADRQGNGVSYDFTVDKGDYSSKQYISFDYDASHAGYADDDIRISVYNVDTDVLIRCNGEDVKAGKGRHLAWFQTDADSTNYRLIFHISSTNAAAYDVYIDNISVGPREVSYGSATNTVDLLLSSDITTDTTVSDFSYTTVIGKKYIVRGQINFSLTGSDTAILTFAENSNTVGRIVAQGGTTGDQFSYGVNFEFTATGSTFTSTTSSMGVSTSLLGNSTKAESYLQISEIVNAVQSEDLGNIEIVVEANSNDADAIGTAEDIPFKTVVKGAAYWTNAGNTGSNTPDMFTAPESGEYDINGALRTSAGALLDLILYINGVSTRSLSYQTNIIHNFATTVTLQKGDTVSFRMTTAQTLSTAGGSAYHYLRIAKRSNPQTILETETVAARYTSNSGQAFTNTGILEFEDVDLDTHNAYNIANGEYTVPVSGKYSINCHCETDSEAWSLNNEVSANIQVNGTIISTGIVRFSGGTQGACVSVSDMLELNKGDVVRISSGTSIATNLSTQSARNRFSIARIK